MREYCRAAGEEKHDLSHLRQKKTCVLIKPNDDSIASTHCVELNLRKVNTAKPVVQYSSCIRTQHRRLFGWYTRIMRKQKNLIYVS